MNAEIRVEGVEKRFGEQVVLDGISCTIPGQKTTVILGPSGTGKSVLLKVIVGLLRPEEGTVRIDGSEMTSLSRPELFRVRRRFGMLFQDGALFDSMSVFENVAFPLRRHTRKSEAEIARIVAEKLGSVGLKGAEGKFPSQLSGGTRKRVGLARAIALDPEVVFFDEPTSGLDPITASAIDELLLRLQEEKPRTFLVISHDLASTARIADYVGVLLEGKLLEFGPKETVLASRQEAVRQFLDRRSDGPIRIV